MREHQLTPRILLGVVLCLGGALAAEPTPGEVVTLTCAHDEAQTYDCYLPREYDPAREWPILYCFSPNANGHAFVDHYKDVCQRHGWIVVASNNARNGPWGPIQAAMESLWKDTQARFPLRPGSCFATGWSGGSAVAFAIAAEHPGRFAGVIPIAAGSGWDRYLPRLEPRVSVYFIMGDADSAEYVKQQAQELEDRGHRTEVHIFQGGHVWPAKEVVEAGVDWLAQVTPPPSARRHLARLQMLQLREDVARRLGSAVRKAAKGDLSGARTAARKVIDSPSASEAEREDARYIETEISTRLEELSSTATALLDEGLPYEARLLLEILKKGLSGEEARQVGERIRAITSDRSLKDAMAAGKLYNRALEAIEAGHQEQGLAALRQVAEKYPDTRYGELAARHR